MNTLTYARRAALGGLLAVVAALALFAVGESQTARVDVDQFRWALNETHVTDRVIHLPEDGHAWHTSVFVRADWKTREPDRQLVAWFISHPQLASLRAQTHFHLIDDGQLRYKARFAASVPTLPAVLVQDAAGKAWYKASGAYLPPTADEMARQISDCFPRPPTPQPGPTPYPQPGPAPGPLPPLPDIGPHTPDGHGPGPGPERGLPWGLMVAAAAVGAGIGLASALRRAGI